MDGSDLDLAPTAMMQRKDGSTLFYDGKLNFPVRGAWERQIVGSLVVHP